MFALVLLGLGFDCSHKQIPPEVLVRNAVWALKMFKTTDIWFKMRIVSPKLNKGNPSKLGSLSNTIIITGM